jgi:carbon storage regulator
VSPQPLSRHAPPTPIRVLLCDAVPVRRAFVRELLERERRIAVIGELADVETYDLAADGDTPDVVIVAVDGARITDAVLLARLRRLANGGTVLALCDSDRRRVGPGRLIRLPRSIGPANLQREVLAAAAPRQADHVGHLVVTRRDGESLMIGDDIEIALLMVSGDKVKLGVSAPRTVKILRREVHDAALAPSPQPQSTS